MNEQETLNKAKAEAAIAEIEKIMKDSNLEFTVVHNIIVAPKKVVAPVEPMLDKADVDGI